MSLVIHHPSRRVRLGCALAASLALLGALPVTSQAVSASATAPTLYPGGRWHPGPAAYGNVVESGVNVLADDGVTLALDITYPADLATGKRAAGRFPVLLSQTPYPFSNSATGADALTVYFASHGYIFVSADIRGTGRSGGTYGDGFRQGRDGAELVDWAAHSLEGSNGVVGLQGCSALGVSQLLTAVELGRQHGADHPVKGHDAQLRPHRHLAQRLLR